MTNKQTQSTAIPHPACRSPGECRREQNCLDAWLCGCVYEPAPAASGESSEPTTPTAKQSIYQLGIENQIAHLNHAIAAAQDAGFYVSVGITTNGPKSGVYLATMEPRNVR